MIAQFQAIIFFAIIRKKISRRNVQVITEKCLKKAFNDSRDKIHTHSLRHTGATILYKSGYDIKLIQEILGHSSVNTTKIYTHLYDIMNKFYQIKLNKLIQKEIILII